MNAIRNILRANISQQIFKRHIFESIYDPPYLAEMQSKVPFYNEINIFLRGYDFAILESYQKFVHKLLKNMDIDVEECWAMPAQVSQVITYKPKTETTDSQFTLKLYERVVQIVDVTTVQLPMAIRAIEASLPPGVKVHIRPHEENDEENRYIPDKELNTLKEELETLGGPLKKK